MIISDRTQYETGKKVLEDLNKVISAKSHDLSLLTESQAELFHALKVYARINDIIEKGENPQPEFDRQFLEQFKKQ